MIQPKLFTPGPLCTSSRVKESMNFDYGSRDPNFMQIIKDFRQGILDLCKVTNEEYQTVLIQGSGTFGIEATVGTAIPRSKHKFLVCCNGAYGLRMAKIAEIYNINVITLKYKDSETVKPEDVAVLLKQQPDITHIGCIHSETTAGSINPIKEIGQAIKNFNKDIVFIVDSMSSFGAYELNPKELQIDYLVASANKNIQGVPGFAFSIAKKDLLVKTKGNARSLTLDLYAQWEGLEANGQFRFTPPTHVIKAAKVALDELNEQGGIQARGAKYSKCQNLLTKIMTEELGFKLYIDKKYQGCIITTFLQPSHQNFKFQEFYEFLAEKNMLIYPGKLTEADSFRIGSIGEISQQDIMDLTKLIKEYLHVKQIPVPIHQNSTKRKLSENAEQEKVLRKVKNA